MSRIVRNWKAIKVEEMQVAPHRYTWDFNDPETANLKEWRSNLPYKEGDVVFVVDNDVARRALIHVIIPSRDRFGDRIPLYRVQLETAGGLFSKLWTNAWAGTIQRGYYLAGRAADLEGKM